MAAATNDQQELRAGLHAMWAAVASGWDEHAEYVDERSRVLTVELLDGAKLGASDRVLELACGPGGLGLAAARSAAEVVLSDVAPEMAAIAARRAQDLGLTNVSTVTLDLERIDQPDATYDVVLCREGLMFAVDPGQAAREIARVLRPGGRVALAVWGPRERNPWLGLVLDCVSAQMGAPVPPPGIPGPFSLSDADVLTGFLSAAGLQDVTVGEVEVPLQVPSFDEWWSRTTALAGPLAKMIAMLPDDATEALRERARDATKAYESPTGLDFPGVSLIATATAA